MKLFRRILLHDLYSNYVIGNRKICVYYRVSIKSVIQETAVTKVVRKRGYYRVQCHHHHHHHVQEGLGGIPVPCILKMKLV